MKNDGEDIRYSNEWSVWKEMKKWNEIINIIKYSKMK
jgi:hypothetical protein